MKGSLITLVLSVVYNEKIVKNEVSKIRVAIKSN